MNSPRDWLGTLRTSMACLCLVLPMGPAWSDAEAFRVGQEAAAREDWPLAAARFEAAQRSFEATLGPADAQTLASMSELAVAYGELARHGEALALQQKLVEMRTKLLGERHPDTLSSMGAVGSSYRSLGRHAESAALLESVVSLCTETLGERHLLTLTSMHRLAFTYWAMGRHAQARSLNETVFKLRTELLGERHPETLIVMGSLADNERELGHYERALALLQKVIELETEVLGERHTETLVSMNNLARLYRALGRHAEQLVLDEKGVRLWIELRGERHPRTLTAMNNLSSTYWTLGRYADALALGERVLELRTQVLGERHPLTVTSLNNLAAVYSAMGRRSEEVALIEKALKLRTELLGERHPGTLTTMTNVAQTYAALGRQAEALALDEKVLRLRREVQGERHPDTLTSLHNVARAYGRMGRFDDQLALIEQAVALREQIRGPRHPETLASMGDMAQAYGALGRLGPATALHEKVLGLRNEVLGERHPDTLLSIAQLARAYSREGRHREAGALAERYVSGAEWQRTQPGLSGDNRRSIFQAYALGYRLFSAENGKVGEAESGFRLAELAKARTLLESMTARRASQSGALPPADRDALEDLNLQVAAQGQLIAQARSAEARVSLEAARNALVRRYEALDERLRARYARYAQLSQPPLISSAQLPGLLAAHEVAVSYLIAGDDVAAWVVDARGQPRFVELGTLPHLVQAIELLRLASSEPRGLAVALADENQRAWRLPDGSYRLLDTSEPRPEGAVAVVDADEVAGHLSRKLLAPLQPMLRGRSRWIMSPDGALAQLPFELLSLNGRRVLEAVDLHYTQSLSVYALAKARQAEYKRLPRPLDLLAFGNPLYDDAAESKALRKVRLRSSPTLSEDQLPATRAAWPALPGTEVEVAAIRRLLSRGSTRLAAQASESELQELNRSGALKNYRILHFAVHGNLSTQDPALSSLVLSQRNLLPGTDGYVTAAEWQGYELRSDLTVLSACETGLGKSLSGEGVMGLPFALFLAGNVNTVLSLWPVLDDVTPLFMQKFYARIKAGQSAARALTLTKREMAAHPKTRHPVHWAPFILVGAG